MPKETVRRNVTITREQDQWLETHPEINVSGLLQRCIEDLISRYREK